MKIFLEKFYIFLLLKIFASVCHLGWGRHLKIPMIGVVALQSVWGWLNNQLGNSINLVFENSLFSSQVAQMTCLHRLEKLVTTTLSTFLSNRYVTQQNYYVKKYFGPNYPDVKELHKDLSLVLMNHNFAIPDRNIRFSQDIVPISAVHMRDDDEPLPSVKIK